MLIERVDWDSQFFGLEIGRVHEGCLDVTTREGDSYDLLYLFRGQPLEEILLADNRYCFLADCKLIYSKQVSLNEKVINLDIKEYKEFPIEPSRFYNLAYLSGTYSRYKLDPSFSPGKFEEMYRLWVDNSISGQIADFLFYVETEGVISAFVTLKIMPQKGVIGLIATNEECQGKGLGKALVRKCESVLTERGISQLEVATQRDNKIACAFYERCNMRIVESKYIYHSWKNVQTI